MIHLFKQTQSLVLIFMAWVLPMSFTYGAEDDLYDFLWLDPDKQVYVLQNKVYETKGTSFVNIGLIKGLNTNFQSTTGYHFSFGHYLGEELAFEGVYQAYSNNDDSAYTSIRQVNGATPYVRRIKKKIGINAVWSPFYGKINTFNKIIYFDWSFGLGVGQLTTESNGETASNPNIDTYDSEKHIAVLTKSIFKVHLNKRFHMSLEYSMDHYKAKGPRFNQTNPGIESWGTNNETVLSFGFNF